MELNSLLIKIKSKSVITAISAAFLLSFTLFFFGPTTLYYTNIYEFNYTFFDISPYLIGLTIIFGLILAFALLLLKGKNHRRIVCVAFTFGLLFYIQGNILVWDYGLLNGQEIIWDNYLINGIIDSLIWIGIIVISLFKFERIYKFITIASIFLILIQMCGLFALAYSSPSEPLWKSYSINSESNFEFSENKNVIIIVLDTFQSDIFQEIINEENDYVNMFDGFTYYRNAVGGYPTTKASIPLILTGDYYNNSIPYDLFINESYKSSLPKMLKENGYIIDIYGSDPQYYPNDFSSNESIKDFNLDIFDLQLTRITLFRSLPHFLKEYFYLQLIESGDGINSEKNSDNYHALDFRFYHNIDNKFEITNNSNMFKFYHLWGSHPPFRLNETVQYEFLPHNRSGYKEQSKASLQIAGKLVKKLKESGIYDTSMIIIIGDHGMYDRNMGLNISQIKNDEKLSIISPDIVPAGLPLVLIKPFNSNTSLTISDAPISISDIPITVANELKIKSNFSGKSMLLINGSDHRDRLYYSYVVWPESYNFQYLPPMDEYTIRNFSWYANSWQPTYRKYSPNKMEIVEPPEYILNTTLSFGKDQLSSDYLISGWSTSEAIYTWSEAKTATIAFTLDNPNTTLSLNLKLYPYVIEKYHENQRIVTYINQHEIGNLSLNKYQLTEMEFGIPDEYLNERIQYVNFYLPDAMSPMELGVSNTDSRDLGIAISSLQLKKNEPQ